MQNPRTFHSQLQYCRTKENDHMRTDDGIAWCKLHLALCESSLDDAGWQTWWKPAHDKFHGVGLPIRHGPWQSLQVTSGKLPLVTASLTKAACEDMGHGLGSWLRQWTYNTGSTVQTLYYRAMRCGIVFSKLRNSTNSNVQCSPESPVAN